jgi:hypothetical protein
LNAESDQHQPDKTAGHKQSRADFLGSVAAQCEVNNDQQYDGANKDNGN